MIPPPPSDRPIRAAAPGDALGALRARALDGAEIVALDDVLDLATVDFLVPRAADHGIVAELPQLETLSIVQVLSAGTDWIEPHVPPQAALCSARGARDAPVAEWALGALLGASTGLLDCARHRTWSDRALGDLGGSTVLIVGVGSIGRLLGSWLRALDVNVVGVVARAREGLHGIEELPQLLPDADAVVLLTPLTDATRGLFGAGELAVLPDGAVVVNAARGPVLDTAALLPEVQSGRLLAALDVTDPEPLPDDHPLWAAPGVLSVTPHIAGDSPRGNARAVALAGDQLARWAAGGELRNVVRAGSR
jgi:phosphoglycerate dehydrogenase-like enzyme